MAGPTTSGLLAQLAGEEWHYVGGASEPAFGSGWENAGTMSDLAFKITNAGTEVRVYGAILDNGAADPTVTTLPEGYRPASGEVGILTVSIVDSMGAYRGGLVAVADDGTLAALGTDTADTVFVNGCYPITPPELAA